MARYTTTIESSLSPDEAFAYMADFSHAQEWDPSVAEAKRVGDVGPDAAFDLVVRFGGRKLPMRYETAAFDAAQRRVVLRGRQPSLRLARHDHGHTRSRRLERALRRRARPPRSPGCSTRCCSCSSTARATRQPRACARRSTGEHPRPRRRGARGNGRRKLHAPRLRRAPSPLRLDAARTASISTARRRSSPARRPGSDRRPRLLAALGAHVCVVGRDPARTESAQRSLPDAESASSTSRRSPRRTRSPGHSPTPTTGSTSSC